MNTTPISPGQVRSGCNGNPDVLELRAIDKSVQDTHGSADVQTATGGTR
jgi:hypothetical protein